MTRMMGTLTDYWWQILSVCFFCGGMVARISQIGTVQVKQGKDIQGLVSSADCSARTALCQASNLRALGAFLEEHKEFRRELKEISTFMGKVEEHMRAQNERQRGFNQ